ncbi:hypothetical protein F5876DRAFT_63972 [Lentinula aff. lateritia]|uniref:Uncharacterized protein n=1 Tax=Lentinula aff. lateritia TaxID=2804960 RepID=A0ACC1U770_9AGAR|nr:hypothetical protein F5876DRAFT_63972 [Lentinula aff. lateritia]
MEVFDKAALTLPKMSQVWTVASVDEVTIFIEKQALKHEEVFFYDKRESTFICSRSMEGSAVAPECRIYFPIIVSGDTPLLQGLKRHAPSHAPLSIKRREIKTGSQEAKRVFSTSTTIALACLLDAMLPGAGEGEGGLSTFDRLDDLLELNELDVGLNPDGHGHHSFDAQEDQEAFLAMIRGDADAEVVVEGEDSIWRDLDYFAATGEFPAPSIQERSNDHPSTSASAHVRDDHDASGSQSPSGIPNQIEVGDDSTDSLFGDSPVAVSPELEDDAPLEEYPALAEPNLNNFNIDAFLTMMQPQQMSNDPSLNMEDEHRPNGSVPVGGQQVVNEPQAIPELKFSPTNTPPEPFPITPPGAITRIGFVNDSILQGYQPFTANMRRGEKRKRLEEEFMPTSTHSHGDGDLHRMGSSIMQGSYDATALALASHFIPGSFGSADPGPGIFNSSGLAPTLPFTNFGVPNVAPPQISTFPNNNQTLFQQAPTLNKLPLYPNVSLPYSHNSSSTHYSASQQQHQNCSTSVVFPEHQFGVYGTMPYGPAGLMSGPNPQLPVVPQPPRQYNTHAGAMNLGGLAGRTESSSSQQLAPYQKYMTNQAELHPAASSQKATEPESGPELQIYFEDGSGKRTTQKPLKRSPYIKMKKSEIPPILQNLRNAGSTSRSKIDSAISTASTRFLPRSANGSDAKNLSEGLVWQNTLTRNTTPIADTTVIPVIWASKRKKDA